MIKQVLVMLLVSMVMLASAQAGAIFSEDFNDSAAAALRFDTTDSLGWGGNGVDFSDGMVKISEYNGGIGTIRTNSANSFVDDGSAPVTYSVVETFAAGGSNHSSLYARLDESGFDNGYILKHYYGGGDTGIVTFYRLVDGAATSIASSGYLAAMGSNGPNTMSITLTNTDTSVDYTISFGSYSLSGSDTDASRVTSGVGTGIKFQNGGNAYYLRGEYDNLTVIPEPTTVGLLGLGSLVAGYRRR